jgi:AraC-like DNA-binding protein
MLGVLCILLTSVTKWSYACSGSIRAMSAVMAAITHSTNDVPPQKSFEYWHDLVCGAFVSLDCSSPNRDTFTGSISSQPISSLYLSTMVSDRMDLVRSPRRIATAREDCFLVALEARTRSALEQDGREGILHAGDFALVDSTRPYTVLFQEDFEHHVLRIPRRELIQRAGPLDAVTGLTISGAGGAGKLASTLLRMLSAVSDTLTPPAQDQVAGTLIDLLAVALGSRLADGNVCESSVRTAWFVRIRNHIDANLGNPALSRSTIAGALGVSVRHVSSIFSANGMSITTYIWERRLHRCHMALADKSQRGRSISSIAFGWGFNDMSHFSRVFRDRYGVSPKEHRYGSLLKL